MPNLSKTVVLDILLLFAGIFGLFLGARFLIDGSSRIALMLGVRPFVIGLTIVGFGTSAPEMTVAILSGISGENTLTISNVIGANISNATYILGASLLIAPLSVHFNFIRREAFFLMIALLLLALLPFDGGLVFTDGVILMVIFLIYLAFVFYSLSRSKPEESIEREFKEVAKVSRGPVVSIILLLLGLGLLILGVETTIDAAVNIATQLGVDEFVIGLTIVSIGTTLPELSTNVIAAAKNEPDLVFGNILGTLIFNSLAVIGSGAMLQRLEVTTDQVYFGFLPAIMLSSVIFFTIYRRRGLGRKFGIVLILAYIVYIAFAVQIL